MKKRIGLCIAGAVIAFFGSCVLSTGILYSIVQPPSLSRVAKKIVTDQNEYSDVQCIAHTELTLRAYAYERSQYKNVCLDGEQIRTNVADNTGKRLPVFRWSKSVFIIVHKGKNFSLGIALSNDPEFADTVSKFDSDFVVKKLGHGFIPGNSILSAMRIERLCSVHPKLVVFVKLRTFEIGKRKRKKKGQRLS